jgi:hypothetical protein
MDCNESFGGKVVVFGGDFTQVLPIVPRGTRALITDATLQSDPWYPWYSNSHDLSGYHMG